MPERSVKFETLKDYYNRGLWNAQMVENAIGRWITAEEAEEILNKNSFR